MAHPDDAELWAGGTLALLAQAGTSVTITVPRHGERVRNAEAIVGAASLGAATYQYVDSTVSELRQMLRDLCPETVITHALGDLHPDHRHIANELMQALPEVVIDTGRPQRLYTCDSYNSLIESGPVVAHTVIDITRTFQTKMCALEVHKSQPILEHFGPMAENMGRLWGARIGTGFGENFVPLPILGRLPASSTL